MNIFIQGMRRSGTTIFFDLFWEDGRFDCYYEPLAAAKETVGGGSGAHSTDFFEKIRLARKKFVQACGGTLDVDLLNYGAPRNPKLEFESHLPNVVRRYVEFISSESNNTLIKFTRMHSKIGVLHVIDPEAKLIHIVRDPRSVTTSYLFGKNQRNRHKFTDQDAFFNKTSTRSSWSSYPFSEFLLDTPEYSPLKGCRDFERILILWKYKVLRTHLEGAKIFGHNYIIVRHEDLLMEPDKTIRRIYASLSIDLPESVLDWGRKNIRPQINCYSPLNKNWRKAFDRIDLWGSLRLLGYDYVIDELTSC